MGGGKVARARARLHLSWLRSLEEMGVDGEAFEKWWP